MVFVFGVALVSHLSSLGFCDGSTGFLRRDSCVPSRQRVLNSSSFVVELRLRRSCIRNRNSSECGLSLVCSNLASRRLDVVCLREASCFIRRMCVFYQEFGLNVAGRPVFGWQIVDKTWELTYFLAAVFPGTLYLCSGCMRRDC